MTAKEKQSIVIKTYLKPTLKLHKYLTNGQTWWRDQGDFFIIINLQNFSFNTKDHVTFCFNIGIALKAVMKNLANRSPGYHDLTVMVREGAYINDSRKNKFRTNNGYIINSDSDIKDFIKELKIDFEDEILQKLSELKAIEDCVQFYEKFPFWGDNLKRVINEHY